MLSLQTSVCITEVNWIVSCILACKQVVVLLEVQKLLFKECCRGWDDFWKNFKVFSLDWRLLFVKFTVRKVWKNLSALFKSYRSVQIANPFCCRRLGLRVTESVSFCLFIIFSIPLVQISEETCVPGWGLVKHWDSFAVCNIKNSNCAIWLPNNEQAIFGLQWNAKYTFWRL